MRTKGEGDCLSGFARVVLLVAYINQCLLCVRPVSTRGSQFEEGVNAVPHDFSMMKGLLVKPQTKPLP
jgi:hypothetical protein